MVVSIPSNISHPGQCLISTLLDDLQVAHLQSRSCIVRNLEVHRNRAHLVVVLLLHVTLSLLAHSIIALHRRETEVSTHVVLSHSIELLDLPQQTVLIGHIAHRPQRRLSLTPLLHPYIELRCVHISRQRHEDLHVRGSRVRLEVGLRLHEIVDRCGLASRRHLHPDERTDLCVQTIGHESELAIGGNEADCFVIVERGETHALMEVNVFQIDVVPVLRSLQLAIPHVEANLVIQSYSSLRPHSQTQLQFWHAGETHLHLDGAHDLAVQHSAIASHQQIHLLDDIQKHVVLFVLDSLLTPTHHVREVRGNHGRLLQTLGLLRDVLLHHLRVCNLGVKLAANSHLGKAKVHHLVEKLVHNDKVIATVKPKRETNRIRSSSNTPK